MDFKRSDFDTLNKSTPSGKISDALDFELYWFHAIAKSDVSFYQSFKSHRHKFFELHFILDGNIKYVTAESEVPLGKLEYVLFAPNQAHKIEAYSESLIKCSAAFILGQDEELYPALISKCAKKEKITNEVESALRFISNISDRQTPYYGLIVKNKVFEIIHGIAGDINQKKRREPMQMLDGTDIRVFKAKRFIKDNPHVFLGCEDMAGYCDISVKHLNRLFLKYEGVSLLQYLHKKKLEQAKTLLGERSASLREISDDLGFSSVYYFSRFFLKHVGITPGQYRSQLDKAENIC